MRVAEEEEEHGDDEGRVEDAPLGQETLHEARAPHQDAGGQGQPLVVGDYLDIKKTAVMQKRFFSLS